MHREISGPYSQYKALASGDLLTRPRSLGNFSPVQKTQSLHRLQHEIEETSPKLPQYFYGRTAIKINSLSKTLETLETKKFAGLKMTQPYFRMYIYMLG